jgi:hypothetical protein
MLTVFSIPKAFRGHIGVIQRNAIRSWMRLEPRPEIVLLGSDAGTAEVAREFGLRHVAEIATNAHGTPLMGDMFRAAEEKASGELLCYVNADILLTQDFTAAIAAVGGKLGQFLMVSRRINVEVGVEFEFAPGWKTAVLGLARDGRVSGDHTAIDVFVFGKGMYAEIPKFAIGRLWFDQWLIKSARERRIAVVDASRVAPVLHQNHDYNHVSGGEAQVWRGEEAAENFRLYGGRAHAYTLLSVTHELGAEGELRRVRGREAFFAVKNVLWNVFVRRTLGLREPLRLRRKFWQSAKDAASSR